MSELTQEYLKSILDYEQYTGIFTYKERDYPPEFNKKHGNKEAGSLCTIHGYVFISIKHKKYRAQRLAWLYVYGNMPNKIDHIDNIRSHNWISNLREATNSQNQQNKTKCEKRNKAGLLGVTYLKRDNRYRAQIGINKKTIYLGTFETAIDAHNRYLQEKRKIHEFNTL